MLYVPLFRTCLLNVTVQLFLEHVVRSVVIFEFVVPVRDVLILFPQLWHVTFFDHPRFAACLCVWWSATRQTPDWNIEELQQTIIHNNWSAPSEHGIFLLLPVDSVLTDHSIAKYGEPVSSCGDLCLQQLVGKGHFL